jgi:periplasmic protein TonB
MPVQPVPVAHTIRLSHMSEGDLIRKVQPSYPPLARSARIQGTVVLQAVISKQGTIENLRLLSGHPMLAPAAIDAVRQWRYRPYILNSEPVEVETQITVNFSLAGN